MASPARGLRHLTWRQAIGLAAAMALSAGAMATAMMNQLALATAMVSLLGLVVFVGVLQVRRRVDEVQQAVDRTGRTQSRELARATTAIAREIRAVKALTADTAERAEQAHRRVVAAVEAERLSASDRQRALLGTLEGSASGMARLQRDQTREVEALLQLFRRFEPRAPMPSSGRWALNATDLLELLFLVDRTQSRLVLELGSGTSSIWLAYALEKMDGRLVSLDHDAEFAARARWLLELHDLGRVAEVRHAPLRPLRIDGQEFTWYDADALSGVRDVDLLLVDGPPGSTGPDARYPALPVLEHRLSATATIVLDDADRPDEKNVLRRWTDAIAGLSRQREILGHQAVLTYSRPAPEA